MKQLAIVAVLAAVLGACGGTTVPSPSAAPPTVAPPTVAPTVVPTAVPTARPAAVAPTVAPPSPVPPSPVPAAPVTRPITFDRTDFKGGFAASSFQIAVNLTNHDNKPHLMDVQANFYDVPLRQLGDDPADHLVTAGTTPKQLAAGQSAAVLINARNVANQRIMSVGFRAICHDASISADCGDGTPSQS